MDVEPERLIALSLGKIALSRGQRGGQRLHKSLLVAGVLLNARTACVSPCPPPSDDEDDPLFPSNEAIMVDPESDYQENVLDEPDTLNLLSLEAVAPAQCSTSRSMMDRLSPCIINQTQLENNAQHVAELSADPRYCLEAANTSRTAVELTVVDPSSWNVETGGTSKGARTETFTSVRGGNKRGRDSVDYSAAESNKRLRYNSDEFALSSYSPVHKLSTFSHLPSATHELMQTDNVQISSLVHSFSAGFSGLLRSVEPVECCRYYGGDDQSGDVHETSSESIISCSTQIREALETLSRPLESLTRPILTMSV